MYWLNGVLKKKLSLDGRVFLFGDGFFTTAKLKNGIIELLDWHIDRLILSAKRLMFLDSLDFIALRHELMLVAQYGKNGLIQVMILRSEGGGEGYSVKQDGVPLRVIYFSSDLRDYTQWRHSGIRLVESPVRLSRNPVLAGIKHLNRLEHVMVRMHLKKQVIGDEALVLDTENNIVECCTANIFWRIDRDVFTPSLIYSGVSGIMRRLILESLPKLGYCAQEVITNSDVLKEADEIFISNSLLPVVSVNSFKQYRYIDRKLYHLLLSYIQLILR